MSRASRLALVALVAAAPTGCESRSVEVVEVSRVEIEPPEPSVVAGDSTLLVARVEGAAGEVLAGRDVAWSSDAPTVATVDGEGWLRGRSVGETRVMATAEGVSGERVAVVLEAPSLSLSSSRVELSAVEGARSETRVVEVSNGGAGEISRLALEVLYITAGAEGWLSAGLNGTSVPTSLTVQASARDLDEGTYEAEVRITSPAAGGLVAGIPVTFAVGEAPPRIRLAITSAAFGAVEGGQASAVQTVRVTNGGGGALEGLDAHVEYAQGEPQGWLDASLSGSRAPADLSVQATPGTLDPGSYQAAVVLTSPDATEPATLEVTLTVAPASTAATATDRSP